MTHHQMVPVNAQIRGDDPDRPVQVGTDGTRVVILTDPAHAELLARMIARVTGELRDVDDVDQVLWDHVTVDLLCAKAVAGHVGEFADRVETRLTIVNGGKAHRPTLRDTVNHDGGAR